MQHVVIVAHPASDSFNCAVAKTYAETLRRFGEEVVVRDLYQIAFNPCLNAEEIPGPNGYGHNRLQEWVLGGVTRNLLRQPERFVRLSH